MASDEEGTVRVVGYIRESQDPDETRPAFAQHEELRRWCADRGHSLIAVCQDTRQPGRALGRDGYVSMLGVIGSGRADMVVIPGLDTLSADQVVQEIMLRDLQSRGIRVLSTREPEVPVIGEEPGPTRMFIRDVLARVDEYARVAGRAASASPGTEEIVVELIPADEALSRSE